VPDFEAIIIPCDRELLTFFLHSRCTFFQSPRKPSPPYRGGASCLEGNLSFKRFKRRAGEALVAVAVYVERDLRASRADNMEAGWSTNHLTGNWRCGRASPSAQRRADQARV